MVLTHRALSCLQTYNAGGSSGSTTVEARPEAPVEASASVPVEDSSSESSIISVAVNQLMFCCGHVLFVCFVKVMSSLAG